MDYSATEVKRIPIVGGFIRDFAIDHRYIWYTEQNGDDIICVDMFTGVQLTSFVAPGTTQRAGGLVVVNNYLFYTNWADDLLYQIDKRTGTVVRTASIDPAVSLPIGLVHLGGNHFIVCDGNAEPGVIAVININGVALQQATVNVRRGLAFDGYNVWGSSILLDKTVRFYYTNLTTPTEYTEIQPLNNRAMDFDGRYWYLYDASLNEIIVAY